MTPEDLLTFIELHGFVDDWLDLKLDVEFDLLEPQVQIMRQPRQGVVIPATGGLRKMDFAPSRGFTGHRKGKRASCRVCNVYLEEYHIVLLVAAYAKSRKADLSEAEKQACEAVIKRIKSRLASRRYM